MAYVLHRKRGEAVDCSSLANMLARRCEGCSLEAHREAAQRFFAAQPGKFDDVVQARVLALVTAYARRVRRPVHEPMFEQADGSTICSTCRRRFYDHAPDDDYPWLNKLCDGRKVKLW